MKPYLKSIVALFLICVATAGALAAVHLVTDPLIRKNAEAALRDSLLKVMPDGKSFSRIESLPGDGLPGTVTEAYAAANGGFVFQLETSGYSSGMKILCGVEPNGKVSGAVCLESGETLGQEKTYGERFVGKTGADARIVDTVSGATKTTKAYRAVICDALQAADTLRASGFAAETGTGGPESEGGEAP